MYLIIKSQERNIRICEMLHNQLGRLSTFLSPVHFIFICLLPFVTSLHCQVHFLFLFRKPGQTEFSHFFTVKLDATYVKIPETKYSLCFLPWLWSGSQLQQIAKYSIQFVSWKTNFPRIFCLKLCFFTFLCLNITCLVIKSRNEIFTFRKWFTINPLVPGVH